MLFDENGMFRLDEEIAKQPTFQKIMEDQIVTDEEIDSQANLVINMLKDMEATFSAEQLKQVEDLLAELEMTASASAEVKDVKWHALEAPEGQKRFMIERLAPAIHAGRGMQMQKERIFSLLQAENGVGHLMLLFVTDKFYREQPEAGQVILKIMDSFKATGYDSPACLRRKP